MNKQTKLNKQVAEKSNKTKKVTKEKQEPVIHRDGLPDIKNPINTVGGKIVIWIMIILMGISPLIALIFYLIEEFM